MKRQALAVALFAATTMAATAASAVTSYLKPNEFWSGDADVTIEGSYATQFFTPEVGIGDVIVVTNPEGQRVMADRLEVTATETTIDATLARGGTYRISTGEQVGEVHTLVGVDGQWQVLGEGQTPPEGAPTTTLQSVMLADTYVTRGTASREVVDQPNGRLAIHPITHPNQVLVSQGLEIELLFDGRPLPNLAIVLYRAGDPETKVDSFVATDAQGRAHFALNGPGQYIIAARHQTEMPPGAPAEVGRYTTTLTFEALTELPAETDVEAEAAERARERARTPARRRVGRPDY